MHRRGIKTGFDNANQYRPSVDHETHAIGVRDNHIYTITFTRHPEGRTTDKYINFGVSRGHFQYGWIRKMTISEFKKTTRNGILKDLEFQKFSAQLQNSSDAYVWVDNISNDKYTRWQAVRLGDICDPKLVSTRYTSVEEVENLILSEKLNSESELDDTPKDPFSSE